MKQASRKQRKNKSPVTFNLIPADVFASLPNPTTVEGDPVVHLILCHSSGLELYVIGQDYPRRNREPHIYAFNNFSGNWSWWPLSKLETAPANMRLTMAEGFKPTPASELGIMP